MDFLQAEIGRTEVAGFRLRLRSEEPLLEKVLTYSLKNKMPCIQLLGRPVSMFHIVGKMSSGSFALYIRRMIRSVCKRIMSIKRRRDNMRPHI